MRRWLLAVLLLQAALSAEERWADLEREWHQALRSHKAASGRGRHPFVKFHSRLIAYVRANANTPAAAPGLVELIRHAKDPDEQQWILVHLRENHMRSRHLGRAVDAIRKIGNEEALRTLEEIAEGSPHPEIRGMAKRAVYEHKHLAVGKVAPQIAGRDHDRRTFVLREYRTKVVVLFFCASRRVGCRSEIAGLRRLGDRHRGRPFAILSVGPREEGWRSWADGERIARDWNALEQARIYILDRKGRIQAKDLWGKKLEKEVERLLGQAQE
jgi:hypothetical protein